MNLPDDVTLLCRLPVDGNPAVNGLTEPAGEASPSRFSAVSFSSIADGKALCRPSISCRRQSTSLPKKWLTGALPCRGRRQSALPSALLVFAVRLGRRQIGEFQ